MLIFVNFHYIRPKFNFSFDGIHGVTTDEFVRQLKALEKIGSFVSLQDVIAASEGRKNLPEYGVCITFDDGLREQYEFALPILQEWKIPATFFVSTNPIENKVLCDVHKIQLMRAFNSPSRIMHVIKDALGEYEISLLEVHNKEAATAIYKYDSIENAQIKYLLNYQLEGEDRLKVIDFCAQRLFSEAEEVIADDFYMSVKELQHLGDLGMLGSHCHTHRPLASLSGTDLRNEFVLSNDLFENWGAEILPVMSYPYGTISSLSEEVIKEARKAGFKLGVTMERAANAGFADPMRLARFSNSDLPGGNSCQWKITDFPNAIPFRHSYIKEIE